MTDILLISALLLVSAMGIGYPLLPHTSQTRTRAAGRAPGTEDEKEALRQTVAELEMDRSTGKLSAEAYSELKASLLKNLGAVEARSAGTSRSRNERVDEAIEEEVRRTRAARTSGSIDERTDNP